MYMYYSARLYQSSHIINSTFITFDYINGYDDTSSHP